MVEFIPRDFFGGITFENCNWTDAGEIIGGIPYHSMANNFTIRGSLKIFPELREHLEWHNACVKRIYDVLVTDRNSQLIKGVSIKIDGRTFLTDASGKTEFSLIFNETSYTVPRELEVVEGNTIIARFETDFFTETPIKVTRPSLPTISIISPENRTYYKKNVPLTFKASEEAVWIGYSLDGQANVTITGNTTLSGLYDGSHSLIVYANDTAGNAVASEIVHFSIDTSQLFPIEIVAVIVIVAIVGAVVFIYFMKFKK